MPANPLWRRYLRWWGADIRSDVDLELQLHMDLLIRDYCAQGLSPEQAEFKARRRFGDIGRVAGECVRLGETWERQKERRLMFDAIVRDIRYAFRLLRRNPGFTATIVLILAIGIGANTAVFGMVDAVLLKPLPYPAPDRLALVSIDYRTARGRSDQMAVDGRMWALVRDNLTAFPRAVFSNWMTGVNVVAGGRAAYVQQQRVGAGFFGVLGVPPLVGRDFTPAEDVPNGPAVTILSYDLWQRLFAGDASIVGRAITLRGEPFTVIGVMPQGFRSSADADLWTPLRPSTSGEGEGTNYAVVLRLPEGMSMPETQGRVAALSGEAFAKWKVSNGTSAALSITPLQRALTQDVRRPLLILWSAVGVVLLIVCVNVAALLLAWSSQRSQEIATRLALGSPRGTLVRQLLVESAVLAFLGGALGLVIAHFALQGLVYLASDLFSVTPDAAIDLRVIAAAIALAAVTAIVFGLMPALRATRLDGGANTGQALRTVAGASSRWPRRYLVVGEVALGVVLLVGAGLLVRTFVHLMSLPPGFDPANVLTARVSLQDARYQDAPQVSRLFDETLRRIRAMPGVEAAGVSLGVPYERPLNLGFSLPDARDGEPDQTITNLAYVTPGLLEALRIPLLRGRAFTDADTADSPAVVIVNQTFVNRYLKHGDPLGRRVAVSGSEREIVGVMGDVQVRPGWGNVGPIAAMPMIYMPATQTNGAFLTLVHTWFAPTWVVRTAAPVEGTIAAMQRAMEAVDPQLPFAGFESMAEVQAQSVAPQRFMMLVLVLFAAVALTLAALGIYGLIARSVVERTRELGIRMALGATASEAMKTIAGEGVVLGLAGVVTGALLGLAATRLVRSFIWGVTSTDATTFAAVSTTVLIVACLASLLPARSVLRLDPSQALRQS